MSILLIMLVDSAEELEFKQRMDVNDVLYDELEGELGQIQQKMEKQKRTLTRLKSRRMELCLEFQTKVPIYRKC